MPDEDDARAALRLRHEADDGAEIADGHRQSPLRHERQLALLLEARERPAFDLGAVEVVAVGELRIAAHLGDVRAVVILEQVGATVDRPCLDRLRRRASRDEGAREAVEAARAAEEAGHHDGDRAGGGRRIGVEPVADDADVLEIARRRAVSDARVGRRLRARHEEDLAPDAHRRRLHDVRRGGRDVRPGRHRRGPVAFVVAASAGGEREEEREGAYVTKGNHPTGRLTWRAGRAHARRRKVSRSVVVR